MDILQVLRERSTLTNIGTSSTATHLIVQSDCSTLKLGESLENTVAAADLFPRVVRLTCMLPNTLNESDVTITVLENPSGSWAAGNGSTLWDSSIALSGYLLKHQIPWLQGKRGLELGAGIVYTTSNMLNLTIHSHNIYLLFYGQTGLTVGQD